MSRYKKVLEEIEALKKRIYLLENPFKYDIENIVYFKHWNFDDELVNTTGIIIDRYVYYNRLRYEILSEKEKYLIYQEGIIKIIRKKISIK